MSNWLRKLMPQQEKFFPLFNQHAELVKVAAEALNSRLGGGARPENLDRFVSDGQDVAQQILSQIRTSFVTPFDRSDIKEMTASMQSVLEEMHSVARSDGTLRPPGLDELGQLIVDCAVQLKSGVAWLEAFDRHADELRGMRDNMAALRVRMLSIRESAVVELLAQSEEAPSKVLASSRLLDRVGDLIERFDEVADHIDDLVLDHV